MPQLRGFFKKKKQEKIEKHDNDHKTIMNRVNN